MLREKWAHLHVPVSFILIRLAHADEILKIHKLNADLFSYGSKQRKKEREREGEAFLRVVVTLLFFSSSLIFGILQIFIVTVSVVQLRVVSE